MKTPMITKNSCQSKPQFSNKMFSHMLYFDFIYKNPCVFARVLVNYYKLLVLRQKVLRITDIAVTYECNAKCPHCCSTMNVDHNKEILSLDEIKSCIKQAVGLGSIIFNFLGGEPLVYKHIYELIRFVKDNNAIAGMSSNGYLLTEDVVEKLKFSGLDVIQVDFGGGLSSEEVDNIRSLPGCYERGLRGVALLKKAGIKVILSTILTKKTVANGDIWKIVEFANDLGVIINVNCSVKIGNWESNEDSLLTETELQEFNKLIKLPYTRWAGSTNYLGEYCPCGTEKIFITAYGDVTPCGIQAVSYGNIREKKTEGYLGKDVFQIDW